MNRNVDLGSAQTASRGAGFAGAIPWLLLAAKPEGSAGSYGNVTSIRRINTAGGVAPTASCAADSTGTTARVPYAADYYSFINR